MINLPLNFRRRRRRIFPSLHLDQNKFIKIKPYFIHILASSIHLLKPQLSRRTVDGGHKKKKDRKLLWNHYKLLIMFNLALSQPRLHSSKCGNSNVYPNPTLCFKLTNRVICESLHLLSFLWFLLTLLLYLLSLTLGNYCNYANHIPKHSFFNWWTFIWITFFYIL